MFNLNNLLNPTYTSEQNMQAGRKHLVSATILFIIFGNFEIFYYKYNLQQVKRNIISTVTNIVYDFPCEFLNNLTLFRTGNGQKGHPNSFSPVTSTKVRISPQNFQTFSFNPFATLV